LRDLFPGGWNDPFGPCRSGARIGRDSPGREQHEARSTVLKHSAGQFFRPLVRRAAGPAAVAVARGGEWPGGYAPRKVEDGADLPRITARSTTVSGSRNLCRARSRHPIRPSSPLASAGRILNRIEKYAALLARQCDDRAVLDIGLDELLP
jgi:hypothetical protein